MVAELGYIEDFKGSTVYTNDKFQVGMCKWKSGGRGGKDDWRNIGQGTKRPEHWLGQVAGCQSYWEGQHESERRERMY